MSAAREEFRPCQIVYTDSGITEYIYEDVANYAKPVVDGVFHTIDWLLAMDDDRLVGVQFWSRHDELAAPPKAANPLT